MRVPRIVSAAIVIAGLSTALPQPAAAQQAQGEIIYAVTESGKLINFRSTDPGTVFNSVQIGMPPGEGIIAIDFRPTTGELFGIGNAQHLYTINTQTGAATQVRGAPFSPGIESGAYAMDFDPSTDRIRVLTISGQNVVIDPDTANTTVQGAIRYAVGDRNAGFSAIPTGLAFYPNTAGARTSQAFVLDNNNCVLSQLGSADPAQPQADSGNLYTKGVSTCSFYPPEMDVTPDGVPFVLITPRGATQTDLYSIDLGTGGISRSGTINVPERVRGLSAVTFRGASTGQQPPAVVPPPSVIPPPGGAVPPPGGAVPPAPIPTVAPVQPGGPVPPAPFQPVPVQPVPVQPVPVQPVPVQPVPVQPVPVQPAPSTTPTPTLEDILRRLGLIP